MATLRCPCGTAFKTETDEQLVEEVQEHLKQEHPGRMYSAGEILMMAALS